MWYLSTVYSSFMTLQTVVLLAPEHHQLNSWNLEQRFPITACRGDKGLV